VFCARVQEHEEAPLLSFLAVLAFSRPRLLAFSVRLFLNGFRSQSDRARSVLLRGC